MDIKDSYLHGTVGVVKSISVSADKLQYKLADIAGTVKEVTLPVATTSANGLMSSGDKTKLDNLSSTIGNYVTLNTDQEITGIKTFTKQQKFTVAKGTAPFQVTSNIKVDNLNADLLDGKSSSDFLQAALVTSSTSQNNDEAWINQYAKDHPRSYVYNNYGVEWQYLIGLNSSQSDYGSVLRTSYKDGGTIQLKALVDNSWGSWKTVAFTDSNITGNAATATYAETAGKLKNKVKLWGQDFDGSADVSGLITIGSDLKTNPAIKFYQGEYFDGYGNFVLAAGTSWNVMANSSTYLLQVKKNGNVGIGTANGAASEKLDVNGNVKATSFIGNLDGTYVNKLTGYTIATTRGAVAATDSLNTALGKLEYKAYLGETAYDWITNVTATDTDEYINKWGEIVGFLDSVKEGTDILDEFVTRKTQQEITASKTFKNLDGIYFRTGNYGLRLLGSGEYGYLQLGQIQSDGTKVHKGQITGIYNETLSSLNIKSTTTVTTGTFTATKLITSGGTSSQFVKGDGSLDSTSYATSNSLGNYVTLNTAQTISGQKTFTNNIELTPYNDNGTYSLVFCTKNNGTKYLSCINGDLKFGSSDAMKKIWHEGNDGSGSGLDADLLDGVHLSSIIYARNPTTANTGTSNENGTSDDLTRTMFWRDNNISRFGLSVYHSESTGYAWKLYKGYDTNRFYTKSKVNGTWLSQESIAFLSDIPTTLKNPNAIKFKNTSGTVVSYDGSAAVDLTGGVYYALSSNKLNAQYLSDINNAEHSRIFTGGFQAPNRPGVHNYSTGITLFNTDLQYTYQFAIDTYGTAYIRYKNATDWQSWNQIAFISDIPTVPTVTDYYWANVKISSTSNNYTNPIFASLFLTSGDATLKMYQGKVRDGYSDGNFCLQTCIDGQDGETHNYATSTYAARNNLILQPRGGQVYIGDIPDPGDTNYKLVVNGNIKAKSYTASGIISSSLYTGSHIYGNQGGAIIRSTAPRDGYVMLASMPSTSGVFCQGVYKGSYVFYYTVQATIDAGTNAVTKSLTLLDESGNSYFPGNITAVNLKKSGSSDSYVLLGGGGHKTLASITAASLNSTTVISAKAFSLSTASWTDTGSTFASLATGTYAIQVTSGSNLVASGIMSVYNNLSDTAGDEIPLHVYGTAGWRPYLRTYANKLQISSNDTSSTSRTVTIKIAQIL